MTQWANMALCAYMSEWAYMVQWAYMAQRDYMVQRAYIAQWAYMTHLGRVGQWGDISGIRVPQLDFFSCIFSVVSSRVVSSPCSC